MSLDQSDFNRAVDDARMAGSNGGAFIPRPGMGIRQNEMAKDAYDKARGNSNSFGSQDGSGISVILAIPIFVCALYIHDFFQNFDFAAFFVNTSYIVASLLFLYGALLIIFYIIKRHKRGAALLPRFYLREKNSISSGLKISGNPFLKRMLLILFILNAIITAFANHKYQTKFFIIFGLFIFLFSYGINYLRCQIKRIQVI